MEYTPNNWNTGDIITAEKLNNIESGIEGAVFGEPVVLVDTTTLTFAKDGDNDWYCTGENPLANFSSADFISGRLYVVNWDDAVYEVFSLELEEVTQTGTNSLNAIGNVSILNFTNRFVSDAPFVITFDFTKSNNIKVYTLDTSETHTMKIVVVPYEVINNFPPYETLYDDNRPLSVRGTGKYSIVDSQGLIASGVSSRAEGAACISTGYASHAEGIRTEASGSGSHSEGYMTKASGTRGHSEGYNTLASGNTSHAEGQTTEASGGQSHSEGNHTVASGSRSHAQGDYVIANHYGQFAFGTYNVPDPSSEQTSMRGNYVEIVGNGTAEDARSNARTLDWSGNEALAGSLTLGKGTADEVTITATQLTALLALLNQ